MGGEEQKRRRRELHLPLSGERGQREAFPFSLLPTVERAATPGWRTPALGRRPAGAGWRRPGSRCSEKRSGRAGREWRMAVDEWREGETDNVSRHRDTGCDGLKTFSPTVPLSAPMLEVIRGGWVSWSNFPFVESHPLNLGSKSLAMVPPPSLSLDGCF